MFHSTGALSPQDILTEVRKFISGAVRPTHNTSTLDVTRTALYLLQNVPAARDAILEYFCNVFFIAVTKHFRQIEVNSVVSQFVYEPCATNESCTILFLSDESKFGNIRRDDYRRNSRCSECFH